ncbi:MAG: hypothetical protein WCK73_01940 [Deltaproteobacteria bacterium]
MRIPLLLPALLLAACASAPPSPTPSATKSPSSLAFPGERHLANIRQLSFGGENAEAYWSFDGKLLIFQSTRGTDACDQQYVMEPDGSHVKQVSNGTGRTTCGYFFPDGSRILYSSTHEASPACPPQPDMSLGYVWPLSDYQIYTARPDGSDIQVLAPSPGFYTAEATVSRDGWIVFTSTRDGDLDLYKMRLDGSELTRLTREPGYDGGAFFSADGKRIVYRASRPAPGKEMDDYRSLLARKMVRPGKLEIMTMDADGTNVRQVTRLGAGSFAPFFFPDGKRIIFSTNHGDPKGRNFDLYLVNDDGTGLERVTTYDGFDGFPMFSPDGKRLVFASNRNGSKPGETNLFIADWVE